MWGSRVRQTIRLLRSKEPIDFPFGLPPVAFSIAFKISSSSTNLGPSAFSIPEIFISTSLHLSASFFFMAVFCLLCLQRIMPRKSATYDSCLFELTDFAFVTIIGCHFLQAVSNLQLHDGYCDFGFWAKSKLRENSDFPSTLSQFRILKRLSTNSPAILFLSL